jgi:hypothetical protein
MNTKPSTTTSAPAQRAPIVPERVRRIDAGSFAFLPHRFLREGFFASLGADELSLYVMLVLVGDRFGVSYYHYDSICSITRMTLERYVEARNGLIRKDLVAFDGTRFQVLSLPAPPLRANASALRTEQDLENDDPATIRHLLDSTLGPRPRHR